MNQRTGLTQWLTAVVTLGLLLIAHSVFGAPERVSLALQEPASKSALQLHSVQLHTDIKRFAVETSVDLVLVNPLSTTLDANFDFPLIGGQVLRSVSIDNVEKLKDGPITIQAKPGQNYTLTLGVTPARGKRVARLVFTQNLNFRGGEDWEFPLDMSFARHAQTLRLTLIAHAKQNPPTIKFGTHETAFTQSGKDFRLTLSNPKIEGSGLFIVSVPTPGIDEGLHVKADVPRKTVEAAALQEARAVLAAPKAEANDAMLLRANPVSPTQAVSVSGSKIKSTNQNIIISTSGHAYSSPPSPMPSLLALQKSTDTRTHQGTIERDTAKYQEYKENPWKRVAEEPVSTFSADVDTGSYANVRRFLQQGHLPAHDAIRAEEMLNYFSYDYATPSKNAVHPFSVHTQTVSSPWNPERLLLRVAIKGKDLAKQTLPPANLVFLVDVSGSMYPQERLPLVKSALKLLIEQLRSKDTVSLVTYASGTRIVLPPTAGDQKDKTLLAIDQLVASGSTNGEAGIRLAYAQAHAAKINGGINRVLLATDGDLNVGLTNNNDLTALVESERKAGISLSTLGVGDSNYNEALMKKLADHGDGSYHYLDSLQEAHKVLVNEFTSTLSVIAKDLKLQVEFNPANVDEYRLIGYELRALTREQFNDDKVDAGDIGAGHSVTALYEIVPHGSKGNVDALRYPVAVGKITDLINSNKNGELAWLKLRYKAPESTLSTLIEVAVKYPQKALKITDADTDFRFATAVAAWAQWLRGSPLIGDYAPAQILALANTARGEDRFGHRAEFVRLVELAKSLKRPEAVSHGSD